MMTEALMINLETMFNFVYGFIMDPLTGLKIMAFRWKVWILIPTYFLCFFFNFKKKRIWNIFSRTFSEVISQVFSIFSAGDHFIINTGTVTSGTLTTTSGVTTRGRRETEFWRLRGRWRRTTRRWPDHLRRGWRCPPTYWTYLFRSWFDLSYLRYKTFISVYFLILVKIF